MDFAIKRIWIAEGEKKLPEEHDGPKIVEFESAWSPHVW
jgi:hypothetical protein